MAEKLAFKAKKVVLALLYIGIYSLIQHLLFTIVKLNESDTMNYSGIVTIIAAVAAFLIFQVTFYLRGKNLDKQLRIKGPVLLDIVVSFALALGFRLLTNVYFLWAEKIQILGESLESAQAQSYNFKTMTMLGMVTILVSIIVVAPVVEEVLFRGIVQKELGEGFGALIAIVLQGLLFGVAHGFLVQSIFTAVFGILLGVLYHKTRNLTTSIMAHMFFNLNSILEIKDASLWPQMTIAGLGLTLVSMIIFFYAYKKKHAPEEGVISGGNNNGREKD